MVTLEDVAALAGVSRATVSRVVNGDSNVKAPTREKVERAVAQLGYTPQPGGPRARLQPQQYPRAGHHVVPRRLLRRADGLRADRGRIPRQTAAGDPGPQQRRKTNGRRYSGYLACAATA